jgi:hypothetical protein
MHVIYRVFQIFHSNPPMMKKYLMMPRLACVVPFNDLCTVWVHADKITVFN